jgi:hypothetical protein
MKMNKWTVGLAAAGVVSLPSTAQAEENSVLTSLGSTVLSGSVEASYIGGFSGNNNLYSDGGDFGANGASLSVGSPLGEGDYSAGYNVELLIGQRAENFGLIADKDFLLKNANIGMNLPFGNGVDLTLGLFDTIVGYEVEASASNPNVTRSYGYGLEPFTHTGLLASTELMDGLSVSAALTNGFDSTGPNNNDGNGTELGYVAGVEYTLPDSLGFLAGNSIFVGFADGNNDDNDLSDGSTATDDDELFYIGASINTPIEGLSLGVAYDDRQYAGGWEADATAIYAVYSLSDSTSVSLRYDMGEIDGSDVNLPTDSADMLTLTINHQLWENLTTRLELGWENGAGVFGTQQLVGNGFGARDFNTFTNEDGDVVRTSGAGSSSFFALNAFYAF